MARETVKFCVYVLFLWIPLCVIFCCLLGNLPAPKTIIAIEALSETIAFRVANPPAASIEAVQGIVAPVRPADDPFSAAPKPSCLSGRLEPPIDTVIRYRHGAGSVTTIEIERTNEKNDPVRLISDEGLVTLLGAGSIIASDLKHPNCPGILPSALPIWGPGILGDEGVIVGGADQPGALLSARVRIYARSLEKFLGAQWKPGVYEAGEIQVLPGSRILQDVLGPDEEPAAWVGSARLEDGPRKIRPDSPGLSIGVSTGADQLSLYRAGIEGADSIRVSTLTQRFNDPAIVEVQLLGGALLLILQLVISVLRVADNNVDLDKLVQEVRPLVQKMKASTLWDPPHVPNDAPPPEADSKPKDENASGTLGVSDEAHAEQTSSGHPTKTPVVETAASEPLDAEGKSNHDSPSKPE